MGKYYLTNKAVSDLANIWDYTFDSWSEKQADKYYTLLLETCQELADNPLLGKFYNTVSKDLKGYKISKHVIFYKAISENEIEVIRIIHSMMDLRSIL